MQGRSSRFATSCSAAILLLTLISLANARSFKNLHTFHKSDGQFAWAGLISDAAGNLYGTTSNGGISTNGTVFQLSPRGNGTWKETVLFSFTSPAQDGAILYAPVLIDAAGNLYGTTYEGGSQNLGTVFELTPNKDGSWSETVLYSFAGGQDGANSWAGLTTDASGNLFGTTSVGGSDACKGGCGTVFELTPGIHGSWSEKVIYSFLGTDGRYPIGTLTFDAQGALYGTTSGGGPYGAGTVFQLVPNGGASWTENVLHSFGQKGDGASPGSGSLTLDDQGNLYGSTHLGGVHRSDLGVAFELTPDGKGGWTESILHSFHGGTDGREPNAGLVFDKGGNLYGTSAVGGRLNYGTVFRLTPTVNGKWHETILHSFQDRPGCDPSAGLLLNPQGVLFGTTGGCFNYFGSVFELIP